MTARILQFSESYRDGAARWASDRPAVVIHLVKEFGAVLFPSPFLMRVIPRDGVGGGYAHWCPGCKAMHIFATDFKQSNGAIWSYNGHPHKPTFSPSMKIVWDFKHGALVCHYVLTDGVLNFLADCTHGLAGKSVPLPELPEHIRSRRQT